MGLQTVWRSLPLNCSLRRDSGDGSAAPCHTGGVTRSVLGSFFFLLIRKKNCSGWQGLPGLTGSALPGPDSPGLDAGADSPGSPRAVGGGWTPQTRDR